MGLSWCKKKRSYVSCNSGIHKNIILSLENHLRGIYLRFLLLCEGYQSSFLVATSNRDTSIWLLGCKQKWFVLALLIMWESSDWVSCLNIIPPRSPSPGGSPLLGAEASSSSPPDGQSNLSPLLNVHHVADLLHDLQKWISGLDGTGSASSSKDFSLPVTNQFRDPLHLAQNRTPLGDITSWRPSPRQNSLLALQGFAVFPRRQNCSLQPTH